MCHYKTNNKLALCDIYIVLLEEWRFSLANNQVHEILIFKSVTRQKILVDPFFTKLKIYYLSLLLIHVSLSGWNSVPHNVKRGIA